MHAEMLFIDLRAVFLLSSYPRPDLKARQQCLVLVEMVLDANYKISKTNRGGHHN